MWTNPLSLGNRAPDSCGFLSGWEGAENDASGSDNGLVLQSDPVWPDSIPAIGHFPRLMKL